MDVSPYSLRWEPFVAANQQASDTMALIRQWTRSDEAQVRPESFETSFNLAEDAGEVYEVARGTVPLDQRIKMDQFLYASWWAPSQELGEEMPWLDEINTMAVKAKGPYADYVVRMLAPDVVSEIATLWKEINLSVLLESLNKLRADSQWPGLWFESAEEVCDYISSWGQVHSLASRDGLALVITMG